MTVISPDMEVMVDSREPDDTLELVLRLFPNAIKVKLEIGDIVYKNLAFELKTWADFIKAFMDKRFRNQLYNFLINKEIDGYYVIYGDWSEINAFSQININAVLGAIASIQGRYGLNILILPNKEYAIYVICKIIEKSFDHKDIRPTTFKTLTEERSVDMLCASADKVGIKDAKNLLDHFGSVREVVNATVKALEKVHKIGTTKAERMWETFNFDFKAKADFDKDIEEELEIIDIEKDKVK